MYNTILFDLDGTITDSGTGVINSVLYALKKYNIIIEDKSELKKFIGPPLQDSFIKFYNFSPEESVKAVEYYREYYREKGIRQNRLYDGVKAMLKQLKAAGRTVILATSKPELFAVDILHSFEIDKYFDFVSGATMDGVRSKKSDVIAYALHEYGITDLSSVVMVGDREQDVIGAKETGIASIGVLYGYGDREELTDAGAAYIAENTDAIIRLVL